MQEVTRVAVHQLQGAPVLKVCILSDAYHFILTSSGTELLTGQEFPHFCGT